MSLKILIVAEPGGDALRPASLSALGFAREVSAAAGGGELRMLVQSLIGVVTFAVRHAGAAHVALIPRR